MAEWHDLALIAAVFLLAGAVKGVIGMGMPTVSLALLTATSGLANGLALIVIPTAVTNVWQALSAGGALRALARHWLFLGAAAAMVPVGALALSLVDLRILSALLGLVLVSYAGLSLLRVRLRVARAHETGIGAACGAMTGVITGMTGSSIVPGVLFLQALGLARAELVQAMGMLFGVCAIALALALGQIGIVTGETLALSAFALVPALVGMQLGQRFARRLPEQTFARLLFCALLLLGVYIIAQSLG